MQCNRVAQIAAALGPSGEVKVVGQQAIGEEAHGHAGASVTDEIDEVEIIALVMEDLSAGVAAVEDVVAEAANRSSGRTWHACYCGQGGVAWQENLRLSPFTGPPLPGHVVLGAMVRQSLSS